MIVLREDTEAKFAIAPELGAWLLRYGRNVPGRGWVEAIRFDPAVVDRYPLQMYAGNPLLFPLVSYNVAGGKEHFYEWGGVTYPLPQHGFARRAPMEGHFSNRSLGHHGVGGQRSNPLGLSVSIQPSCDLST